MNTDEDWQHAADLIEQAQAILVTAGAGMGVDSGLPDFRGSEGFWQAYPALGQKRLAFYQIACPAAFRRQPQLAWGFYGHRLQLYRLTQPHAGFAILADWGRQKPGGLMVRTTNVDGQFQRAGFAASQLMECHGSIHHLQCLLPCSTEIWPADDFIPEIDTEQCLLLNQAPRCPRCGGLARPNILMFDDDQWLSERTLQQEQKLQSWLSRQHNVLIIELGAGQAIPVLRHFAQRLGTTRDDSRLLRINPREAQVVFAADVGLYSASLAALTRLQSMLAPDAA